MSRRKFFGAAVAAAVGAVAAAVGRGRSSAREMQPPNEYWDDLEKSLLAFGGMRRAGAFVVTVPAREVGA